MSRKRHFYAGGERHELEPAEEWLGIDTRVAAEAGLSDAIAALPAGSKLPSGIILVHRAEYPGELLARIEAAGAALPAFRSGRAVVVLMPEVRVEFDSDQHADALRALRESEVSAEITDDSPNRLALRPRSGKGEDALDLANYIYEQVRPAASSVRMLQVVPKPLRR